MIFRARPRPSNFAALFFSFLATCLYLFRFWAQSTIFLKDFGTHPRIPFAFDLVLQGAASLLQDVYQNLTTIKLWIQTTFFFSCFLLFLKDARPARWGPPVRAPGRSALWKIVQWKSWNIGHTDKLSMRRREEANSLMRNRVKCIRSEIACL